MLKIIFNIERNTCYRFLSPLISELLENKIYCECWHNYSFSKNSNENFLDKKYLFPKIETSPFYKNNNLIFKKYHNNEDFLNLVKKNKDVTYFFSLNDVPEFLLTLGISFFDEKWCIIIEGFDFYEMIAANIHSLSRSYKRYGFCYSKKFHELGLEQVKNFNKKEFDNFNNLKKIEFFNVGMTQHGGFLMNLDKNQIYKKYDLPKDKKILVYIPFGFSAGRNKIQDMGWQTMFMAFNINPLRAYNKLTFLKKIKILITWNIKKILYSILILKSYEVMIGFIFGYNEKNIIKSIKIFCNKNNLSFVIKKRKKFILIEKGYQEADLIIDDDESQQYPNKLQEILNIADLGIGCFSTTAHDFAKFNIPYINIEGPDKLFYNALQKFKFSTQIGSMYNYPGVIWNMTVPNFISRFKKLQLDSFKLNQNKQILYDKKYLGKSNTSYEKKIYNILITKLKKNCEK